MKKIRELFDRENIFYVDQLLEDIFINYEDMSSTQKIKTSRSYSKSYSCRYSTLSISHTNQFFYHPEIPQEKEESSIRNSQKRKIAGNAKNISLAHTRIKSQFVIMDENGLFRPVKSKVYFEYKKCN